jgi:peptidyl-tRNA hydrolase
MSIVTVKHKNGNITHFVDCHYNEKCDKIVVIHDEVDLKNGGLMPQVQKIYDKSELESIKYE